MAFRACGIDFGTTNSSAALCSNGQVRVLQLDDLNDNPYSLPSLVYISRSGEEIIGRRAAQTFIERNVDREVLLRQVKLETAVEAYVGSEPDKSEGYKPRDEMYEGREAMFAHVTLEVNSPGRLFQSIKSMLRFPDFKGTEVFGTHYQIEELVSLILKEIRNKVCLESGEEIDTVVLGRPVCFAKRPEEDEVAERRLRRAAELAGFREVVFFYEPVAACVEYAVRTDMRQRLMVVDIGGGTCDVCVMEFGGGAGAAERLAESRILGVAGVPIAGDVLDRELIRAKVFPLLGSRSRYGPSKLPMPQNIYNSLLDWQNLYKLNTEETLNWLIAVESSSTHPEAIRMLRTFIQRNYGYPLVRKIEQAKKTLSEEWETHVEFRTESIHLQMPVTRSEFTHIIEPVLDDMLECIKEAEANAGITPEGIDLVLTTGGTCLVPAVRHMLVSRYGDEKLLHRDTFTSVAAGLAIVAQYI
ncbi:MAG TPA: Hsp70 family protein [Candidatus Hydrogenedentes bacterium]|nr:Hsp70 family protein [Candidatus Hydrogenedentota bacterium]HOL78095.1 Hsp70 family protein [Candidatus Hydrogenedentota bacterium]HPO86462.1 Hsp70 family protein [Candidatus Hydrogenedentota bacterium]